MNAAIDEYPTEDTGMYSIDVGINSNISSIKLTEPQLIPNRIYGKWLIYKITCEIKVNTQLFSNDFKEQYKDGVEIKISLPSISLD